MRALLVLGLACALGCAHDAPPPDGGEAEAARDGDGPTLDAQAVAPDGRFVLTGIREPIVARISATEIQGAPINLGRYPSEGALRGRAFGRAVSITVQDGNVRGIWGRSPFELTLTQEAGGWRARGLVGGTLSDFTFDRARINGSIGRCGYDVRFQGEGYVGQRACRGGIQQVAVTLPPALNAWRPAEIAVALGLLMSAR